MTLHIRPITLALACEFVRRHHRHHRPPVGHKFSVGVTDDTGKIRGVLIASRPTSRVLDDGLTVEFVRVCTDGARNAPSKLLGAAWRASKAMGFERAVTFTMPEEGGASLRAAGWLLSGQTSGRSWARPSRLRTDKHPISKKWRWTKTRKIDPGPRVKPLDPDQDETSQATLF